MRAASDAGIRSREEAEKEAVSEVMLTPLIVPMLARPVAVLPSSGSSQGVQQKVDGFRVIVFLRAATDEAIEGFDMLMSDLARTSAKCQWWPLASRP